MLFDKDVANPVRTGVRRPSDDPPLAVLDCDEPEPAEWGRSWHVPHVARREREPSRIHKTFPALNLTHCSPPVVQLRFDSRDPCHCLARRQSEIEELTATPHPPQLYERGE